MKEPVVEPGQSLYVRRCFGCGRLKVEDVSAHHAPRHQDPDELRFTAGFVAERYRQETELEWMARQAVLAEDRGLSHAQATERLMGHEELGRHGGWYTVQGRLALCWGCHARYLVRRGLTDRDADMATLKELRDVGK